MSGLMTPIAGDRKRRICYFFDSDIGNYHYGPGHPMKPHRIRMTHALVMNYGLYKKMEIFRAKPATRKEMAQFHTDDYVEFLSRVTPDNMEGFLKEQAKFNLGDDCPVFDGLFEYCSISAGGSMEGAARLSRDKCDIAVNWAGGLHHAKKAEANGFCYVNDIVLGILELLRYHKRVLYVDIDVHHGDGVEEAFYTTDRVMTCSFHKYGEFFPGTGELRDIGSGKGKRYAVNFPLRDGITDEAYKNIFEPVIMKIMETYQPSAIVLQCGGDSLAGDRLGSFNVSLKGHANCVQFIKSLGLPLLLLGGGGYTIRNVSRTWAFETGLAAGQELCREIPMNEYYEYFGPTYHLDVPASNMEDMNVDRYLEKVKVQIFENLRHTIPVPSVEMQPIPRLPHDDMEVDEDLDDPNERKPQRLLDALVQRDDEFSGSEDEGEGGRKNVQSNKRPRKLGRAWRKGGIFENEIPLFHGGPDGEWIIGSDGERRLVPILDESLSGSSPLSERSEPPTPRRDEVVPQAESEEDMMELDEMATALVEDVNRHTSQSNDLHQQQEAESATGGSITNQQISVYNPPTTSSVEKADEKMDIDEVEPRTQLKRTQEHVTPSNPSKPESNEQTESRPAKISVSVASEIEMAEGEPSTSTSQIKSSTPSIVVPSEKTSEPTSQTLSNVIMSDSDVTALQQILDSAGSDMSFDTSLPSVQATLPPVQAQPSVQVTRPPVQATQPPVQATRSPVQPQPLVQATHPPIQATHPSMQATQPPVQATHPAQATQPPIQATQPPVQPQLPVQATRPPAQATRPSMQATHPPVQADTSAQAQLSVQAQPPVQATRPIVNPAPVDVIQTASTKLPEVRHPDEGPAKIQQTVDTASAIVSPNLQVTLAETDKPSRQSETRVPASIAAESIVSSNQVSEPPKPSPIVNTSDARVGPQPLIRQTIAEPNLQVLPECQILATTIEASITPKVIQPTITAEVIPPPPINPQESKAFPTSLPATNVTTSNLTPAPVVVTQPSKVGSSQSIASIQQPVASDQVVNPRPAPIVSGTVSSLTANLPKTPTPSVIQSSSNPVTSNPITSDKLASDWKDSINPSLVVVHSQAPMNEKMTKVKAEPSLTAPQVILNEIQPQSKVSSKALSVMEEMELVIEQQRKTQTNPISTNLTQPTTTQENPEPITPNVISGNRNCSQTSNQNVQLDRIESSSNSITNPRIDETKTINDVMSPIIEMDPQLNSKVKSNPNPIHPSQPTNSFTNLQSSTSTCDDTTNLIGQTINSLQNHQTGETLMMEDEPKFTSTGIHCEAIDPAIQGSLNKKSGK